MAIGLLLCRTRTASADDPQVHRVKGLELYRAGDFEGALAAYRRALTLNPEDASNHAYVATACYQIQDFACAEQEYKVAIDMQTTSTGRLLIPMLSNLGGVYHKTFRYQEALDAFTSAQKLSPSDASIRMNVEAARVDLHKSFMEGEILAAAEGGSSPFWDVAHMLRGTNYSEQAEVVFKEIVETRSPRFLGPAIRLLQSALQSHPNFAISAHLLADAAVRARAVADEEGQPHALVGMNPASIVQESWNLITQSLRLGDGLSNGQSASGSGDTRAESMHDSEPADLLVTTVATSFKPELKRLRASAEMLGWNMTILGLGDAWRGLGSKVQYLQAFLHDKHDMAVVLFVDAYDVLFLSPAKELVRKFLTFDSPVVMSAERTCAPDAGLEMLYPKPSSGSDFKFVNSGSYIGRVWAVKQMLQEIQQDIHLHHSVYGADPLRLDDQRWFTRYYLRNAQAHPSIIKLDTHALLFQTLHDVPMTELFVDSRVPGLLKSQMTGTEPCLVHGNGNGMQGFHAIARHLEQHGWPSEHALSNNGLAAPQAA